MDRHTELDIHELYRRYCIAMDQRRQAALEHLPPGKIRSDTLRVSVPIPFEHYEADIERMRKNPSEFERYLSHLDAFRDYF